MKFGPKGSKHWIAIVEGVGDATDAEILAFSNDNDEEDTSYRFCRVVRIDDNYAQVWRNSFGLLETRRDGSPGEPAVES